MSQDAPPPYDQAKDMYPNQNAPPAGAGSYQPNMSNPYPQSPQQPAQTYVYVTDGFQYGPRPMHVTCPHCHQQVLSRVNHNPGLLTWLLFGGCLIFGCVFGCCLIPFCMDDCQDCEHYCRNCNAFLGQYKRL